MLQGASHLDCCFVPVWFKPSPKLTVYQNTYVVLNATLSVNTSSAMFSWINPRGHVIARNLSLPVYTIKAISYGDGGTYHCVAVFTPVSHVAAIWSVTAMLSIGEFKNFGASLSGVTQTNILQRCPRLIKVTIMNWSRMMTLDRNV